MSNPDRERDLRAAKKWLSLNRKVPKHEKKVIGDWDMITPVDFGGENGAIIHVRSHSFISRQIRKALSKRLPSYKHKPWGNHDAVLALDDSGDWFVLEATMKGFKATPWGSYLTEIVAGNSSVVFLRQPGLSAEARRTLAKMSWIRADRKNHIDVYDFMAIAAIAVRAWFNLSLPFTGSEWRWYCTEHVSWVSRWATLNGKYDVWGYRTLPTTYTTEKRAVCNKLEVLGEMGEESFTDSLRVQGYCMPEVPRYIP